MTVIPSRIQKSRYEGYREGYSVGYVAGIEDGRKEGYDKGYASGHNSGSKGITRSHYLRNLKVATDEAIATAKDRVELRREAINWGDLSCIRAEYCEDNEGLEDYRVWIEEASPTCSEFQKFITEELAKEGYLNIEVCTEW